MRYRVEVIADDSGKWVGNALLFDTQKEAEAYADDLAQRWTLVQDWRVVPVPDTQEGGSQRGQELGGPVGRYKTAAQEKAEEKRLIDVPLAATFSAGQSVRVDRAWKSHWTFKEAPAPTRALWSKLFTQVGTVSGVDDFGNVWVQDRFDQMMVREGFPVPARFVKHA